MNNEDFVASLNVPAENQQRILEAMEKYGDNHWWEDDVDPRKYAYHQLHEPIWISSQRTMRHFHESTELLVDRQALPWEYLGDDLKQEAERAWTYQVGCTSDTERDKRVVETVQNAVENYGVQVITLDEF